AMQADGKRRAFAFPFTGRADRSIMKFDNRPTDGQPETESTKTLPSRPLALFESVENLRQSFRTDSHSGVRDFNNELAQSIVVTVGRHDIGRPKLAIFVVNANID